MLYKMYGDLENRTNDPVIVLGGPGFVHNFYVLFSDLSVNAPISVILYDQIEDGHPTHLREKRRVFRPLIFLLSSFI
jgi:hypothetical protein